MIVMQADFNRLKAGRLVLSRLAAHEHTPFAELAASGERVLFIHGEDVVEGRLIEDAEHGWLGDVDWATQDVIRRVPDAPGGAFSL